MAQCSFCGNTLAKGTGKMYVRKDATINYFCSNKCEKNLLKLRRVPRTTKWTKTFNDTRTSEKSKKKIKN